MKKTSTRKPETIYEVLVIGGGAAGMMTAIVAAEAGKKVILLEKNSQLGSKLAITGGGRCNITNAEFDNRTLLAHYGPAADYLYSPFAQFTVKETMAWFEDGGLKLSTQAKNRVFPDSEKAEDVVRFLQLRLRQARVTVKLGCQVNSIQQADGRIIGVHTSLGNIKAASYVLACGGLSRPETGSTGDGFKWLEKLGHSVRQPTPSIVPIAVSERWVRHLAGKTVSSRVYVWLDGKQQFRIDGRILFTHFGLSGPTILNSAAKIGELMEAGKVQLTLDLFPDLDHGACDRKLVELFDTHKNKELKTVLKEWLPDGLSTLPKLAMPNLLLETKIHSVSKEQRKELVHFVKAVPLTVSHLLGFDKAVVADGGVSLKEIDMRTMRSTSMQNLLVVGDLLDIKRPSGGYSLQLCWTTGFVAGKHA